MNDDYVNIDPQDLMRPDDFTGCWEAFWPSGRIKYRGLFAKGVRVGQHVCFWEDGTVAEVVWYDSSGCPRGTAVSFYADGDKEAEQTWDEECRHPGSFERRSYDENGDVCVRTVYREFTPVDSWSAPSEFADDEMDAEIDRIVSDAVEQLTRKLAGSDVASEEDDEVNGE
jgi:hypothetical protein